MKHKILLIAAVLCMASQGAWADKWDGVTYEIPEYNPSSGIITINTAAEFAYIHRNWGCSLFIILNSRYHQAKYKLNADLDMTIKPWTPLGSEAFTGTFDGNGHTIRITISDVTDNYQGLFGSIDSYGKVRNLHVAGNIHCKASRLVGGICGENDGTIENCWVSANVSSDWKESASAYKAKVGGICGENNGTVQFCCMTGNVKNDDAHVGGLVGCNDGTLRHCTFYGTRSSSHSQYSKYVGKSGTEDDLYDTYYDVHYGYSTGGGQHFYAKAYKYPYTIQYNANGYGHVRISAGGENDIRAWHPGETVTLTKTAGLVSRIDIKDADGNNVSLQGQSHDGTMYWFVMPSKDVTVTVFFEKTIKGSGTENDPYLISSTEEWNELAYYVANGNNYRGKFVKLMADISVSDMLGTSESNSFQGTFLGNQHKLTFTKGSAATPFNEEFCAPFRYVKDATIRNLRVAGDIYSSNKFIGGLVSLCYGTTSITDCHVATIIHSSTKYPLSDGVIVTTSEDNYDGSHGGIVAFSAGTLNITDCAYTGRLFTTTNTYACGGFVGWNYYEAITVTRSLYAPNTDITAEPGERSISDQATFVRGGNPTLTNCFYTETMGNVQGKQALRVVPSNDLTRCFMTIDGKGYYIPCTVSNVMDFYEYTGQVIPVVPTITAADDTVLKEGTDYTFAINPATVQEKGYYTMTITGKGRYIGTKTMTIEVEEMPTPSKLTTGEYEIKENVTRTDRIYIKGDVVLNLAKGITCTLKKGIELREGNSLTINGEGTLIIEDCESGKSGIGANSVGTLTINGGILNVTGGDYAAAIGGDKNNAKGGSITINGGVVKAKGGKQAAGIGGGADDQPGHYGVCGDITINGGQVTAQGGYRIDKYWRLGNLAGIGPGAEKPNPEGDYYDSGTLKLGWTKPTDFIDCSGFANPQGSTLTSITFAEGKEFWLEGTETVATIENCRCKKLETPFGTEKLPYTISNTDEWNDFVSAVAGGNNYKGKFVKLTADISVTEKVGTVKGNVQQNAFSGTFDGDGHTITATITDNSNQGAALFCYINGATIKNLKVAGTINSSQRHAAAIVGFSKGTGNSIVNCAATANVNGNEYIGGILGHAIDSDISISGCTFSGLMTGGSKFQGAIIGWGDSGTRKVTDCLYIMQDGQDTRNLELVKNSGKITVTNTYKTTKAEQGGSQPKSTRSLTPSLSPEGEVVPSDSSEVNTDDDEIDDSIYDAIWANEYDTMPDYFGEFVLDYGFLKVYEGGLEYDGKYYVANILLADEADNYALISLANEYIVDATLTGRTFYKDGTWQTICLPFDLGDPDAEAYHWFDGTPLEGASVKALGNAGGCTTGFDTTTGTLTLDFVDADRIEAGKPYIVKWNSGGDIVNPVFRGVTISDEDPIEQRTMSEDERVHFLGIYCPVQLEANNYANLYLGPDGKLHCPEADGFYLNAFRAGFLVDLGDVVTPSSIVINLGEGTGIRSMDNGQLIIDNSWYSLDGRKLQGKPSRAGVYINNGIKRVVK